MRYGISWMGNEDRENLPPRASCNPTPRHLIGVLEHKVGRVIVVQSESKLDRDPVRLTLKRRLAQLDMNMSELSVSIGKNRAYIQQFLRRGNPYALPEDVRAKIAHILQLPEDDLRHFPRVETQPPSPTALPLVPDTAIPSDRIPLYRESTPFNRNGATEWIARPSISASYGFWIEHTTSRFRPGDMVLVHSHRPPRPGDLVAVVKGGGAALAAIGDLVRRSDSEAEITVDGASQTYSLTEYEIDKIVGAIFA